MLQVQDVESVVVGAGIMGVSTAYYLNGLGGEVVLLERKAVGEEASGRNAGSLSLQNKPYSIIPLCQGGIATWREIQTDIGGLGFAQSGGFRVAEDDEQYGFLAHDLEARNRFGLGIERLPIVDARQIAPYLSPSLKGGNFCSWDSYVDARVATQRIALAAQARGVQIITRTQVTEIIRAGRDRVDVVTEGARYRCRQVLIAAGVWTRELATFLDLDLPINLRINQMSVTTRIPRVIHHMITHARGHLTLKQLDCGSVLIGGGWPGSGDLGKDEKWPRYDSIIGNAAVAVRVVPELAQVEAIRTWAGFDGRTADELPILGPVPGKENVLLASSCFGGYVAGPYIGKLMAQIMAGRTPELSLNAFSPGRYG